MATAPPAPAAPSPSHDASPGVPRRGRTGSLDWGPARAGWATVDGDDCADASASAGRGRTVRPCLEERLCLEIERKLRLVRLFCVWGGGGGGERKWGKRMLTPSPPSPLLLLRRLSKPPS
jgi:hypothetical protein